MKIQIAAFLVTGLMASMSLAQTSSVGKMPKQDGISSKGFRVSLVRPMLEAEFKIQGSGQSFTSKSKIKDSIGLAVGYVSLPVQSIGWTGNLAYMDLKDEGDNVNMLRADGNVAYAFTNLVNVKGGLNLTKFTSENAKDYRPAIGLQASVGFQATKNFGIDFGYTQMNQTLDNEFADVKLKMSGFEIAVNGTF